MPSPVIVLVTSRSFSSGDLDLLDATLFTPHAGAQTVEAVDGMGRGAVDAVLAQLRGEQPPNLVLPPANDPGGAR